MATQWGSKIIHCTSYLLPAGGAVAEHCQLPDWLLALSEGDGHHQQQVEAKLQAEGGELRLHLRPLQEVLRERDTNTHTHTSQSGNTQTHTDT